MLSLSLPVVVGAVLGCHKQVDEAPLVDPELSLFDPAPAEMLPDGRVTVRGEAKGLTDLRLNGALVHVDGNLWDAEYELPRGVTTFEVSGVDGGGDHVFLRQSVLAGDFAGPNAKDLPGALGIRVNQGALDAAGDLVGSLLDPASINDLLAGLNPVYEDSYGVFGLDAVTISADIESVAFDPAEITLDPGAGALTLGLALPNVEVVVPVSGDVLGIDFDEVLTVEVGEASIGGALELDADDGALAATLAAPTVVLRDFVFDTSILPGSIESAVLSDTIRTTIEDLLVEQMSALLPTLLDQQLAGLDIALDTEILGNPVSIGAGFGEAAIDRDGLLLVADLSLDMDVPAGAKPTEGFLLSGAPDPRPSTSPDLAVLLGDDVVNKLLHDAWRAGVLDLTLSTDDGSLDAFLLSPLGAGSEASIAIDAGLPPVLVQVGDRAMLAFGELVVEIGTPGGENGDRLVIDAAGQVPLDLELVGGSLTMALGAPELTLMVRDSDWGADNETVTNLLEDQLPVELLFSLLGDVAIPMPTIGDLVLPDAAIGREASGTSTTIDIAF